jgi:hypothetical protein
MKIPEAILPRAFGRRYHQNRAVHLRRAGDHVLHITVLASDSNAPMKVMIDISTDFPDGLKNNVTYAAAGNANRLGLKSAEGSSLGDFYVSRNTLLG